MEIPNTTEPKLRAVLEALERSRSKAKASMHDGSGVQDSRPGTRPEDRNMALDLLGGEKPISTDKRPSGTEEGFRPIGPLCGPITTPSDRAALYRMVDERAAEGAITPEKLESALTKTVEETELNGCGVQSPMNPHAVDRVAQIQERAAEHAEDVNYLTTIISMLVMENQQLRTKCNSLLVEYMRKGLERATLKR